MKTQWKCGECGQWVDGCFNEHWHAHHPPLISITGLRDLPWIDRNNPVRPRAQEPRTVCARYGNEETRNVIEVP